MGPAFSWNMQVATYGAGGSLSGIRGVDIFRSGKRQLQLKVSICVARYFRQSLPHGLNYVDTGTQRIIRHSYACYGDSICEYDFVLASAVQLQFYARQLRCLCF